MRVDRFEDESLLRLAAIEVYEDAVKEYQSLREDDSPAISQRQVDEQFKQLMARYRQEQGAHRFRSLPRKVLRRAVTVAAAIAILCSSAFTVAMASSPTIREIIMEDFGEYSDLVMILSGGQKSACPEGWEGRYYPAYIPEGYTFYGKTKYLQTSSLLYINNCNQFLTFTVILHDDNIVQDTNIFVDTENMVEWRMVINNQDVILYVGEEKASAIVNYQDCVLLISGPVSQDVIIKIVKGVSER